MSYATGTAHYNLPQTVGTDKRDWFDTNQAFYDIDEATYGAVQQSTSTATAVTALTTRVGTAEENIADLQASRTTDEARISTLETVTSQHTTDIADVRADALDMICAVDEGTAQVASVAVSEGNYFRYNDVLYMATTDIAVGDTIVPNTNCRATNVATELKTIGTVSDRVVVLSTGNGTKTIGDMIAEGLTTLHNTSLTGNSVRVLGFDVPDSTSGTNRFENLNNGLLTTLANVGINGICIVNTASMLRIEKISSSLLSRVDVTSSDVALTSLNNIVPDSGIQFRVYLEDYV